VIADLNALNRNSEQDFLQIGGKLVEFIEAVNLISAELTALANLISGEQGLRASEALTCALDGSMEMRTRYRDRNVGLRGIRQDAGRLKRTLSGFHGIVSTFHTLGVLTQIETARLGREGADFGSLADDVKLLAGSIQARVETARDTAALLIPPIEGAMQDISALEEGQAKDLPSVISKVRASLSEFRAMQSRVHDSSVRLGAQYYAISGAFKNLIVSIQFHDITRQQVQHVVEALERLCSESEEANGSMSRGHGNIAAVLALQSSQLTDAGEKFASSVASVGRSLDEIAVNVREMAEETRTLTGLSEDEKNSFFVQMEQGCAAILASLRHCASAETAMRVTSGGLAETIRRMLGSIEEIRAVEIHVQRMALNGGIRAAHIGSAGDVLSVLAGSIQQLAVESRQLSDSLIEALGSMSAAATGLSAQGPVPAGDRSSQDGDLEGMRVAVAELHSSSERSFSQIAQIVDRGVRLREELSATRQCFSVGAVFADTISRARSTIKEIGEKDRFSLSPDSTQTVDPGLTDFARHYTMQAERDVHQGITRAAVGATPVAVPVEQLEFPPKGAGELGENVEFF
jgi:hypothetical protein